MNHMRAIAFSAFALSLMLLLPASAQAQFGAVPFSDPATGETYHIEGSASLWNPTPQLVVSSEALGIAGSTIDAVGDLGIEKKQLRELRLVLRPARKHKFRLYYLPMSYAATMTVTREFIFNGLRYRIGLPVATALSWKSLKLGYEYDFTYHDRWFAGFITEIKFTDVLVELDTPVIRCIVDGQTGPCLARAQAPIPTFGGIARVYVVPNISITGEMTGIKLPESISEDYRARYLDFDLYGTVNFNDYVGVHLGYREINMNYKIKLDKGDLVMKGLYFGGVVRY